MTGCGSIPPRKRNKDEIRDCLALNMTKLLKNEQFGKNRRPSLFSAKVSDFEKYSDDDPMMLSLIFNNRVKGDDSYEGIVFVDIFADQYCPNGNEQNIAMLYVAPPYGPNYENEEDFIVAISETAKNISNALISYNEMVKSHTDLSIIEAIRLCTYSSGIYNRSPKVGVDIISTSIFDSLVAVLKATESGLKEIQLPNGLGQFSAVLKQLQN